MKAWDLLEVRREPLKVEAVRPDLAAAGDDQRARRFRGLHFVEVRVDRAHRVGVETILVVAQVEDKDVSVAVE